MEHVKFRAWRKTKEKYYHIVSLNFYTQEVCIGKPYNNVWVSFDDVVLELYTGLKDKNDVEIYVGDIVEFEDIVGEVQFLSQQNGYAVITHNSDYRLEHLKYSVIGNIHENKFKDIVLNFPEDPNGLVTTQLLKETVKRDDFKEVKEEYLSDKDKERVTEDVFKLNLESDDELLALILEFLDRPHIAEYLKEAAEEGKKQGDIYD